MGEYADWFIDNLIDERGIWGGKQKRPPLNKTCKYCGKGNLRWGNEKGGKWILNEVDGTKHFCKMKDAFKCKSTI